MQLVKAAFDTWMTTDTQLAPAACIAAAGCITPCIMMQPMHHDAWVLDMWYAM